MARIRLNLDYSESKGRNILVHGGPGVGKSYLAGSFLKGRTGGVLFLNLAGEDGTGSLVGLGLGEIGETVENVADIKELVKEYSTAGLEAVAIDSLRFIWQMVIDKVCGKGNLPKTGGSTNHWGQIHHEALLLVKDLQDLAPHTLFTCPSDRSLDQVREETRITPDLPGRMAAGIAGSFDVVGYLEANTVGSKVKRTLHFEAMGGVVTRLRAATEPTKGVVVGSGPGAWAEVAQFFGEVKA